MTLIEVNTKKQEQDFLLVPVKIYQNDPNWIRPLDKDILAVFNPKKNKAFRDGEVMRWILANNDDQPIGRIAAFVQKNYRNKGDEQATGGIGFFECINNQEAADMLFDVARSWLMQRGMEAMDGPINFGERDRWWGLVTEGFQPPIYLMNYNPPYYKNLFEDYGFKIFYNQICWHLNVSMQLEDRFYTEHAKYEGRPEIRAVQFKKAHLEKFATDFATVYNKAWAVHEGNKEMAPSTAIKVFKAMKPAIDEDLVWFVYHKDEPIAFWLNLPDLNQIFRYFNGKFGLVEKIRYLYLRYKGVCTKFTGIVFGVSPEWQGKGIDYFMIVEAAKLIQRKKQYEDVELQWQGDFNPKMLNISRNLGAKQSRLLATYRYLFDRSKEFKRHPVIGS